MSHEGGSERSQRTVAELLAMYGGDSAERAPRRRRRRPDDVSDTAPQAIAERILSESGKLSPIREDQPPPERTSHRQRPDPEPPAPPRRAPAPPPVSAARPAPPPRTQLPPPPPQPTQRPPLPPRPDQPAIAQASEPTRPVRPRRARRGPPPQAFQPPDGGQPIRRDNGVHPEPTTEQLPRIPGRDERGGNRPHPGEPPQALGSGPRPAPAPFPPAHLPQDPFATNVITPGTQTGMPRDALETVAPARQQRYLEDDYPEADLDLDERDAALDDYPGYSDEDDAAYADEDDLDERGEDTSAAREWLVMAGQVALSVLGGAAVWLGFNWLWGELPQAALGAAVLVIVGLVWIVRKLRKADDLQTTVLAVLVGLVVTVSPAALLLVGR